MNGSLASADRQTHIKVVVLALLVSIAVIAVSLYARPSDAVPSSYAQIDPGVEPMSVRAAQRERERDGHGRGIL